MTTVLGHDPSWTGWGYCLATEKGPWCTGHFALGNKAWPWDHLRSALDELDDMVKQANATIPNIGMIRVVVEVAPAVYSGRARGQVTADGVPRSAGNQAAIGQGLGQLSGPILLWGTRPGEMEYPWEIEVSEWRRWWRGRGRKGKMDRAAYKSSAIDIVRAMGWARYLEDFADKGADRGPMGDVAEAILIAVGAAEHPTQAPVGPIESPAWKANQNHLRRVTDRQLPDWAAA